MDGLEEATCPSCSLKVKVIYNKVNCNELGENLKVIDELYFFRRILSGKMWS